MNFTEVRNKEVYFEQFNYLLLTPSVLGESGFFKNAALPKGKFIANAETMHELFNRHQVLSEILNSKGYLAKNKDDRIFHFNFPILPLLLKLREMRGDLKVLYLTADKSDAKQVRKFLDQHQLYIYELLYYENGKYFTVTTKEEKQSDKEVEAADEKVTFIIKTNFARPADELRVVFRSTELQSDVTKRLFSVQEARAQAKRLADRTSFMYQINKSEIINYSYIAFAVMLGKVYRTESAVKINFALATQNITLTLNEANEELLIKKASIFDSFNEMAITMEKRTPPSESEKFKYYGGQPISDEMLAIKSGSQVQNINSAPGQTFRLGSGRNITLGKQIGAGGEGIVYETNLNGYVAKMFRNPMSQKYLEKYEYLAKNKISHPHIMWPQDVIKHGYQIVGYTMFQAAGNDIEEMIAISQIGQKSGKITSYNDLTRLELVNLVIDLLSYIAYLHDRNVILADIKTNNFMYDYKTKKAYVIDADSFQIGEYTAGATSNGYQAPEFLKNTRRGQTHYFDFEYDYFAIFALVQKLLTKNLPFKESEIEKTMTGDYFFAQDEKSLLNINPGIVMPWFALPQYMKELFINAGSATKGKNFAHGTRLTPDEWIVVLKHYRSDLEKGAIAKIHPSLGRAALTFDDYERTPNLLEKLSRELVHFKLIKVIEEIKSGISLARLIENSLTHADISRQLLSNVLKEVRTKGIYDSKEIKIDLTKNAGIYYEINYKYRG